MTVSNTPALDQWNGLGSAVPSLAADDAIPDHCKPAWCDEVVYSGRTGTSATMLSEPASVALRRHPGVRAHGRGRLELAVAYVDIRQHANAREPYINVERWAAAKDGRARIEGSDYELTLAEAEELANTVLLAVATAREAMGLAVSNTATGPASVDINALVGGGK